jgi:hypothetical protein
MQNSILQLKMENVNLNEKITQNEKCNINYNKNDNDKEVNKLND